MCLFQKLINTLLASLRITREVYIKLKIADNKELYDVILKVYQEHFLKVIIKRVYLNF